MAEQYLTKRIDKPDGTKRLFIMERLDGHYRFVENSLNTKDSDGYWTTTYWSGIYETAEAAEHDAVVTFPWARDER